MSDYRQLYRDTRSQMLAGVCAGLGKFLNMDPTVIRLLFVLAFFVTGPGVLLAYFIMMLIVPAEPITQ